MNSKKEKGDLYDGKTYCSGISLCSAILDRFQGRKVDSGNNHMSGSNSQFLSFYMVKAVVKVSLEP